MTRIIRPRELEREGKPLGLFHMTVSSDEEDWCYAIGPCASKCPGHPTPEEARAHYQEGKLTLLKLDGFDSETQKKCIVCGEWTQTAAYVDDDMFEYWPLCTTHLTLEEATRILLSLPKQATEAELADQAAERPVPVVISTLPA
jgi:hypothetical protein